MKPSDLLNNIGIKVICLLLAIVVWLYANKGPQIARRVERKSATILEVPVQLKGLPLEQWKPNPDKVALEVEWSSSEIILSSFQAIVKLIAIDGAEQRVALTAENVELPEGMSFIKSDPGEIELIQ